MKGFIWRAGLVVGAIVVLAVTTAGVGGHDAFAVTSPASQTHSRVLGNSDNGGTVSVAAGEVVIVRLSADNWTIGPSTNAGVLRMTGAQRQRRDPRCVSGGTCGTTRASFTALRAGQAVLHASRNYCGEAILCTPATDSWSVTIDVTAH
ncbi:MAG: hypothetical protein JO148_11125 [Acidimicrobiia bacterium]|nr:hypothetical protein [Acidimicrobiia bacterium]